MSLGRIVGPVGASYLNSAWFFPYLRAAWLCSQGTTLSVLKLQKLTPSPRRRSQPQPLTHHEPETQQLDARSTSLLH